MNSFSTATQYVTVAFFVIGMFKSFQKQAKASKSFTNEISILKIRYIWYGEKDQAVDILFVWIILSCVLF